MSVSTEVPAPRGFRAFRIEHEAEGVAQYRVEIDRIAAVSIPAQADMDPEYVRQTVHYAVRQLAFDVRDIIEETL